MTLSKEKFEHILAYAKQQQKLGVQHCNILPDDMVEIMEMAEGNLERRERDGQEPVAHMSRDNLHAEARFSLETRFGNWSPEDIAEYEVTETKLCAEPPAPVVPKYIPDTVYEILYQACGDKAWMYEEALWSACRAAMHRETISNSGDFAIDEAEPVSQPYKLVGEVVAWNAPQQQGVYRSVDFRWIDMDVPPGTKLYAMEKE